MPIIFQFVFFTQFLFFFTQTLFFSFLLLVVDIQSTIGKLIVASTLLFTQRVVITKSTFGELMVTESMPAPLASIEALTFHGRS